MLITALLMASVLTGAPPQGAPVDDPGNDPEAVVATAPATSVALDATAGPVAPPVGAVAQSAEPHGLSTDQQIAQWLTARAPVETRSGDEEFWRDDRKPHGEVSVGFGTGGYRNYGAAVSLPLGESGRLDISLRQVENGYPYGYGYGYGRGYGYGYEPGFDDGGYAFPGAEKPGATAEYESRLARPGGPPWLRLAPRAQEPAPE